MARSFRTLKPFIPLLLTAIALTAAAVGSPFVGRQIALIAIMSMVVVGLNISYGYAGELALGQAAMYATGAYLAGYLALQGFDFLVIVPLSALAAALIGLITGIPSLRLGGWSLAMVSFFLVLLIPDVVDHLHRWTGGHDGMPGIPMMKIAGRTISGDTYVIVVVLVATVVFAAARNLVNSRVGSALLVLKQSPVLATSLGISVFRAKLTAYVIGAVPAGMAGALFAYLDGYIGPMSFSFSVAVGFLAASILGGSQSVYGALLGSALLVLGPLRSTDFQEYSLVVYGLFLIVGGLFLSGGISGLALGLARRMRFVRASPRDAAVPGHHEQATQGYRGDGNIFRDAKGERLYVSGVTKRFGAATAVRDLTIEALPGQVTAVIGANGSGKTTLLNMISGFYSSTTGEISLGDAPLSGLKPHTVAKMGVARTFQTPTIPQGLTTLEVVTTARYADFPVGLSQVILRLRRYRSVAHEDVRVAREVLHLLGLQAYEQLPAASLPLGTRRLLEVARAVARRPKLILLDEPASGLDSDAVEELSDAIRRLRDAGITIVLIEHNFPLVLELADNIYVLQRGALIAQGGPEAIRNDPAVIESYLGSVVDHE